MSTVGAGPAMTVTLRPARANDARLLYEWANDPAVRAMARDTRPIAWDGHRAWFAARLARADCRILIAEVDGEPVGQVRLDRQGPDGGRAEIDISVAPARRGRGHGRAMLAALPPWPGVSRLVAVVRRENAASAALFRAAGFTARAGDEAFVTFERDAP